MSDLKCIWCGCKLFYIEGVGDYAPTTPEGHDAIITEEGYVCPCCGQPYYEEIELSKKQEEWRKYR